MGTISEKLTYLNVTKQKLKQAINNIGGEVTDETTFRNYVAELENAYDRLPKTEFEEGESVTLENTLKGKLDYDNGVVGIGQSSQESTQGYQLLNITATSGTKNGATWVVNEDKSITISTNGATTGVVTIPVVTSKTLEAGTYYMSGITGGTENTYFFGILVDNPTQWVVRNYNGVTQFSVSEQKTYRQIWVVIAVGTNLSTPITVYPMISKTNTSQYEPYTGGYASPSPNWEQEVKCVAGRNKFNIGTSLDDYFQTNTNGTKPGSWTVNAVTATIEENKLTIDTYNSSGWNWLSKWVELEPNTDYTISGTNTSVLKIVGFNSNELQTQGTQIIQKTADASDSVKTFNSGDYKYYCLSCFPEATGKYFENIQIEEGSQATPYLPYNTIEEVVSGKNLANVPLPYNTEESGATTKWINFSAIPQFEIGKTYYLYGKCSDGTYLTGSNSALVIMKSSSQFLNKPFQQAFTCNIDISEATGWYIWTNSSLAGKTITEIGIYEGTSNKPYEPYKTPKTYQFSLGDNKFYGIGTYRDYILRTTGKNLAPTGVKFSNAGTNQWYDQFGEILASVQQLQDSDHYIDLKPNANYTFFLHDYKNIQTIQLIYLDGNNNISAYVSTSTLAGTINFTTTSYTRVYIRAKATASNVETYFISQIEEGSTASDYQPYGVGNWYKVGKIGEIELDETLNWEGGEVATGIYRYQITVADAIDIAQRQNVLTEYTHFTLTGEVGTGFIYSKIFYFYPNTDCTNALLFKAWIANHHTPLLYPLATPTYTPITGTLAEQLEEWWNGQSIDGTTIIEGNGDLPMIIKVRGLKGE